MNKATLNYGKILKTSWEIVKSRPYLWVLGILAGGGLSVPNFGGWNFDQNDLKKDFGSIKDFRFGEVAGATTLGFDWFSDLTLISFLIALVVLFFVFIIISTIFRGGLIHSVKEIAHRRESNLQLAWQAGKKAFWPLFGLQWLTLLIVVLFLGPLVTVMYLISLTNNSELVTNVDLAVIAFGIIWGIILIAFFVLISLIYPYIERRLVLEKVGVKKAVREGVRFFRTHWLEIVIVALIGFALALAWTLALGIILLLVGGFAALVIFSFYYFAPMVGIVVGIVLAIPLLVALIVAFGFFNSYLSTLFTGLYLALAPHTKFYP